MEILTRTRPPEVSIVIVNYKSEKLVDSCVRSIDTLTKGVNYEIVVVDNSPTRADFDVVSMSCRVMHLPTNVGFAAASNVGIQASTAPYVLLLNPDTILVNDAIQTMVSHLTMQPMAGVVGCKLLNEDGSVQLSCRHFPTYWTGLFNRYSLFTRLMPSNPFSRGYLLSDFDHNSVRDVDWVSGACMMIRRKMLADIGLLDEAFFLYSEDVDLCYRAKVAGWKVIYAPTGIVMHHIGGSSASTLRQSIVARHHSLWTYYRKHMRRNWLLDATAYLGIHARCQYHVLRFGTGPRRKRAA